MITQSEVRYSQHAKRILRQAMRQKHKEKCGWAYAKDKAYLAVNLEYWRF